MTFYRNIEKYITDWRSREDRKPLVIRGARQVGKTTLVKKVGSEFKHFIALNLEKSEDRRYFEGTDNVKLIFESILLSKGIYLKEGEEILLFIDEIQQKPLVIGLLRYFYEELPHVHLIAAGSLLEFALGDVMSMPVGRVEQVVMYPLSFDEFLFAIGHELLLEKWINAQFESHLHTAFMDQFMKYIVVGGMPAVVKQFVQSDESYSTLPVLFDNIWLSYLEDISKYGKSDSNKKVLQYVMEQVPYHLDRFSFASFGQNLYKSREISEAFYQLEKAHLLKLIYPTISLKLPIIADVRKRPRLQFLDTGLLTYINKKNIEIMLQKDISDQFRGGIINHIVLQQIIALSLAPLDKYMFWVREASDSNAEVDLVIQYKNTILPIEVKAGATGRLRSLFEFIDRTDSKIAVRVLDNSFNIEKVTTLKGNSFTLINIPVYAVGRIHQLLDRVLG